MASLSYDDNLKNDYQTLFQNCIVKPEHAGEVDKVVSQITENKARYEALVQGTDIPWFFIGCVHYMECGLSFNKHLYNGDLLTAKTVRAPIGRPLFPMHGTTYTFEESARDAIEYQNLKSVTDWSLPHLLYKLEGYNGYGYRQYHPTIKTPYLWSFSNQYASGKYVEEKDADGVYHTHFKPEVVSKQLGIAVVLKRMVEKGLITV